MKNTLNFKSFLYCMFLSCLPLLASGDEITLTNGTKLEGVIIAQDAKSMLMETRYGSMTLTLKSIKEVKQASKEDNLLLRGDFFREKGKYDEAMKYYQEALLANPKSQKVRDKYDDLNRKLESLKKSQALALAKKVEPQSVTHENVEDAKTAKDLKKDEMFSLQATGEAMYPLYTSKGEDKEKITIQNAKLNALSKIFTDSMGYGFEAKGNKAKILPPGELPNVKIKVLKQDKLSTGYRVQIQVLGPTNSVMVKLPDNFPLTEAQGVTPDIRAKSQTLLRQRALETTMLSAVETAVAKELEAKPKNKNKKVFGRVYPVSILQEALTPQGYFLRGNFKVWIDPAYETVK
jgi:tetratricopeptide (TPR) repeat protein